MKVLLFGVSCVGKSTLGKLIADKLNISYFDLDDEIKAKYNTTIEEFVHTGSIEERDEKRGILIGEILSNNESLVMAVTVMSYSEYFTEYLSMDDVIAIELTDSPENIFERIVFSDENDVIYKDDELKNKNKDYFLNDIKEDLKWYGSVYRCIENKYDIRNLPPEEAANEIIDKYLK